ncbi:UDP-N-acetylglucosamine--N-acetylmuramyl-(pentapeptide) pyrophosphoryl-undecaprenol N-acetylglucosamine transferase [[Leptolyngbya] sp. PCC 7376]|uniref:undecaprenyldiphospho-muramoylpentapeptide beta-N-acetylglucosaminyltransferase n=1 Tax=[Leptolyngbya] sp. PCC 7376 TaxID=111781 RepID=UPI00029F2AFB|nr:undecaprenyldiphospho-muramoylpentapeptide beta-N-acetylglucosaminyltransferase [[Leptolyngbya] sp. PCC 7376]AFY39728.1 UDP-N-acetylglucosamine--N-acetylmuramyl-(pentapeptide) pyrophosphoryl-undecaprenol N-acetylglucosamine transferase [[Leptolyngbya] sp. PCC 7376]
MTRILIAASGTGGHLFPALAVAQKLSDCDIQWLGVSDRLETTLVPKTYPLNIVTAKGLQGNPLRKALNGLQLLRSIFQTKQLISKHKIDLVFTTGGYIAAPAILAAKWQGIPVILHESNVLPGKVTRFLGKYADTVVVGFADAAKYLPDAKTLHLGTPVREEFLTPQPLSADLKEKLLGDRFVILAMGGSQGAVGLNQLVRQCAASWIEAGAFIVHITGKNDPDVDSFQDPNYLAMPFAHDIAALIQNADFVISRSGASALTELTITKTPSVLVPYPYAAEDHQTLNAEVFANNGAGLLVQQNRISPDELIEMVLEIMRSPGKRQEMSDKTAALGIPESADKIAHFLKSNF